MSTHAPTPAAPHLGGPLSGLGACRCLAPRWSLLGRCWPRCTPQLDGQAPPCTSSPDLWTSADGTDALVAAERCHGCPARKPCQEYGEAIAASVGVFGGHDMTVRDARQGRQTSTDDREDVTA